MFPRTKHGESPSFKGKLHGKMKFHINVRVGAGEWCGESLSSQLSFVSEKIDHEQRDLMTKWDLRLVT